MNDKSDLLGQLKIDRSATPETRRPLWPFAAIAGAAVLAVGGYLLFKPADAITVKAVTVRAAGGDGGGSVLDASGYVVARRAATVSSKVTGKVQELHVEEGAHVKAGEVLARLDDSNARAALALARAQLEAAKAALAQTQAQRKDAERQAARNKELVGKGLVSQSAYDTAQATADALAAQVDAAQGNVAVAERNIGVYQQQLDDTVVRAPFDGVITVKNAQPGEMISPLSAGGAGTRTGIGTLVDMDSLEIEVDVNENFINRVQPGQPVTGKLNAYPDWQIPCEVIAVIPTADRSKATVKVRVRIKTKDPRILPDMGVRVSFLDDAARQPAQAPRGFWIPDDAVQAQGTENGVVYVLHDDKVERRAVKLGGHGSEGQQVLSGLTAGERVASGDLSKLQDGSQVKLAE
ncbi:MAG: efflux RND transporter periplasmic adaptor subunit [Nevskiaceae bacterium]|nr:MAG: efflux RND transporter periplasmic adaptor subunit [Nevskiaceae bacterium]